MEVSRFFRSQVDNLDLLNGVRRIARQAVQVYGVSRGWAFRRAMLLVRRYRFKPPEAFDWGLMDPKIEDDSLAGFVSKAAMSRMQNGLNPLDWYYTTEDKSIFYRICQQQSIPIPKLYGIGFKKHPGWLSDNGMAVRPQDWESVLGAVTEPGIVIKPSRSLFGRGVEVYSKEEDHFLNSEGFQSTTAELARRLCSENNYNSLIVQERLRNHAAFAAVGKIDYLQTLRIITLVNHQGEPQVLAAFLKLIRGENATDNWDGGRSGNLILRLDSSGGTPVETLHGNPDTQTVQSSPWLKFCELNPDLKSDFTVPEWADVITLSKKLALTFLPLRTVGWDLAVTDNGVAVLEGNYRAGPYPSAELRAMMKPAFDAMLEFERA